mgnify:CR=1 FL=1
MLEWVITEQKLMEFREILYRQEKRKNTIDKYMRDIRKLQSFAGGQSISQELLVAYKEYLTRTGEYCASSINSFLAAANCFCSVMGWTGVRVKLLRVQREVFIPENKELTRTEYERLIRVATMKGNIRLALLMQTIGSTGIRIGELSYVTVESLQRGMTDIYNKGKMRRILYPTELICALQTYVENEGIQHGYIFRTRLGAAMNRSNIWRAMKRLCTIAHVDPEKVYPHNLRHLFARCFYQIKPDIAKLADVLGHCNIETTRIYIKSTGKEHKTHLNQMKMIVNGCKDVLCGKQIRKRKTKLYVGEQKKICTT